MSPTTTIKRRSAPARALANPLFRCKVQRDRKKEQRNTHHAAR